MGDWDTSLKTLVAECPQAFAELVLRRAGAQVGIQFQTISVTNREPTEFQREKIDADALLNVRSAGL